MEIYSSKDNDRHGSHPNYDMETFSSPVQASHSYPYTNYETQELALARSQQYQRIISQSGKTESKPRLTREEVETLEREFQVNPKPNRSLKAKLADELGLERPRINNWFQNRRAKDKQEKKQEKYEARQAAALRAASELKPSEDQGDSNNAVSEFHNLSNHSRPLLTSSALHVNTDGPSDQQSQSLGSHDDGDNEDDNFTTPAMSPIHPRSEGCEDVEAQQQFFPLDYQSSPQVRFPERELIATYADMDNVSDPSCASEKSQDATSHVGTDTEDHSAHHHHKLPLFNELDTPHDQDSGLEAFKHISGTEASGFFASATPTPPGKIQKSTLGGALRSSMFSDRNDEAVLQSLQGAPSHVTPNEFYKSSQNEEDAVVINSDGMLSKLEAPRELLTTAQPFSHRKENIRGLLFPGDQDRDSENNLQLTVFQISSSSSTQLCRDVVKGEREPELTALFADGKQLRKQPLNCKKSHVVAYLLGCLSWMRKITRPKVKPEFRRIEWKCDCGANLYADFPSSDENLDSLALSLQNPKQTSTNQDSNVPLSSPNASIPNSSGNTRQGGISNIGNPMGNPMGNLMKQGLMAATSSSVSSQVSIRQPRFLALCVNTGGIYKTLAEIDTSGAMSDAAVFFIMKNEYLKTRGLRSRFKFLIKPATIEFVQFTLWNRRGAYISVCNRPNCIPPDDSVDYEYSPKPLRPLLPMPPEIFIHYLDHGEGDLSPVRNDWFPRLPKRLNKRVIDCDEACFGWGVHIIEGPNREVIFWIAILTILASVLTSVLWSTLKSDVQGGAGLGALIVALPPAILAAFLFRLGGI